MVTRPGYAKGARHALTGALHERGNAAAGPPVRRRRGTSAQTRPAFSSAVQQVSTISRVTTYGSTLAFGRRSSM
jgi:hypothetical protein